jgi:hypothetical protein
MVSHVFCPWNELSPATFYWGASIKPRQWMVMYLCVKGIDFAIFYDTSIGFWFFIIIILFDI